MSDKVSVSVLRTYEDKAEISAAFQKLMAPLGGLEAFVRPGMTVFIKANLMRKSAPELAVTTHPAIVAEVVRRITELGATAVVGDSPGGPFNESALRALYASCEYDKYIPEAGGHLNYDTRTLMRDNPEGEQLKSFEMVSAMAEADLIINIAKLKTHALATYTGAIKNMYGVIPGLVKAELHFSNQTVEGFSNVIIDIDENVKQALNIIDAVVGMEGDGPGSGTPREIGALIASASPYAADVIGTRIVGFTPEEIPMLREAKRRGLWNEDAVELVGEPIDELIITDYKRAEAADNSILRNRVPRFMIKSLEGFLALRPFIKKDSCVGCGVCARVCPAEAIKIRNRKAHIARGKCIKCFCCGEFCPKKAVEGKRNPLLKVVISLANKDHSNKEETI